MKNLLSCWPELSNRFKKAKTILLMCDYDGTLTPIVKRPKDALISAQMRGILRCLRDNRKFKVAIISGRGLAEIKKMVGVKGLIYAGNHGMELQEGNKTYINQKARLLKKTIKAIYNQLIRELKGVKGAIIEDKSLTLSLHYRLVRNSYDLRRIFNIVIFDDIKGRYKIFDSRVCEIEGGITNDTKVY